MGELTNERIKEANERGRVIRETQPHARNARYDSKADRVIVELTNGATFAFPPRLVEGLHNASAAEIGKIEVIGRGFGLHWEELDLDYTVPGLVSGVFGTGKWMAAHAGRTTSPAKAAAARANGAKGGRPKKPAVGRSRA